MTIFENNEIEYSLLVDTSTNKPSNDKRVIIGEHKLTYKFEKVAKVKQENLQKLDYDNDVNVLMGGEGISNRLSLQAIIANHQINLKKKHEEFIDRIFELTYRQILENISEAQKHILEAVNKMKDVINRTGERIEHIQNQLQNMTRRHQELNDVMEAQYFEKDSDGNYKSKVIADTVRAYEQRKGEKLNNDITPEMLILILRVQEDFEKAVIITSLENELVKLDAFRNEVIEQKESFEEENERISKALKAIDADTSLSDEERRNKKTELLEQASKTALDAQVAAHSTEQEYTDLVTEIRKDRWDNTNESYYEHSDNEDIELNQSALDELPNIKPLLAPSP